MRLAPAPRVAAALAAGRPVVALESTVIAHGLPHPLNEETALACEHAVREAGAEPATIAVAGGEAVVGADAALLHRLATEPNVMKVSLRDLAPAMAGGGLGATTVAATVELAARAGIAIMATGGIGGVHRGGALSWDVSADLGAIARHPVCVVCAGAKLVLDLPLTLEALETLGVPVIGYRTDELPAFYVRTSGVPLAHRVDDPAAAAAIVRVQRARGAGLVITQPIDEAAALDRAAAEAEVAAAVSAAERAGIRGAALTPFLLAAVGEATGGAARAANRTLLIANARLAGELAAALAR